jgi:hypothetical protein
MARIHPNPGNLPTGAPPEPGDKLVIRVKGNPPIKDISFSIRNPKHPKHNTFKTLRFQATKAMAGKRWYTGAVELIFTYHAKDLNRNLVDYISGIMDTLDGSHGETFTYLPIVYQDDCQICSCIAHFKQDNETWYTVEIIFH